MPHWLIKSAIHHAISVLPRRQLWNEFFQKYCARSLGMTPEKFEHKVNQCRTHLNNLLEHKPEAGQGFAALEFGYGWYPIVPVGFFLCGATDVWAIDIDPLLRLSRVRTVLEYFSEYDKRGKLRGLLPGVRAERMEKLRQALSDPQLDTPERLLGELRIHVMVGDARKSGLASGCVDLVASIGVLEYIPRPVLLEILVEFRRLLRPGGVMSHWISLIDQYSYFDKSITPFNYLKYSNRAWKIFESPLIPQNRLRICDYRQLYAEAGFQIVKEADTSGAREDLARVRLAPEFRHYSEQDLLVLTAWLVGRAPKTPPPTA